MKNFTSFKSFMLLLLMMVSMGAWAESYQKITSVSALESGCDYLIVYETSSSEGKAMTTTATTTNTKRLTPADVTISNGSITTTATSIVWTLSGSTDNWMFNNGTNYVNGTGSGAANCTGTSSTGNKYTITANTNGTFDLTITGNAERVLEYNTGGPYFAHYKSTQKAVCLYKKVVSAKYTVNFNAGSNGTCSTTSLTEASPGSGVTLPSCTPNSGYVFLGWTATKDNTTIDKGLTAGSTYKPTSTTTLYAVYSQLYTVSYETPQNGTLVIKAGENSVVSGSQVAAGTALSVECTPADGYKFRNWQYKVEDNSWVTKYSATQDFEMPSGNVQFRANFDEIVYRTITWSVNGNTSTIIPSLVENGKNITFPTGLEDIYGKKFVGWSANDKASSASDLVSGDIAASTDATYYAVYATATPSQRETATLTCAATTENTTYTTFNATDDQDNTWEMYANTQKKSDMENDIYYGLTTNSKGYHVSSPTFSGNILSIKMKTYNGGQSDRHFYFCSSTENKQPSSGDIASLSVGASQKGKEQTVDLTSVGEFKQFNIYTDYALAFKWIEVTYGAPDVISDYTTTVEAPAPVAVTVNACGNASFSCGKALDFTNVEGVKAYMVTAESAESVTITEIKKVPAYTGIFVIGEGGTYNIPVLDGDADDTSDNMLVATITPKAVIAAENIWALSKNDGKLHPVTSGTIATGKAYFVSTISTAEARGLVFVDDENTTSINSASAVKANGVAFNLAGQRVAPNAKGIVIVNGKKFINK